MVFVEPNAKNTNFFHLLFSVSVLQRNTKHEYRMHIPIPFHLMYKLLPRSAYYALPALCKCFYFLSYSFSLSLLLHKNASEDILFSGNTLCVCLKQTHITKLVHKNAITNGGKSGENTHTNTASKNILTCLACYFVCLILNLIRIYRKQSCKLDDVTTDEICNVLCMFSSLVLTSFFHLYFFYISFHFFVAFNQFSVDFFF